MVQSMQLPLEDTVGVQPGVEETVTEMLDGARSMLSWWIVTWATNATPPLAPNASGGFFLVAF
jgi:hypothetical protein